MSRYSDVFVIPVPIGKLDAYRALAAMARDVWREHGALDYVEVIGDDVKQGKLTSFPQAIALEPDEAVVVAVISYHSRAHRDEVNAKAMADPRMAACDPKAMPFDGKRMIFGGFSPLVS